MLKIFCKKLCNQHIYIQKLNLDISYDLHIYKGLFKIESIIFPNTFIYVQELDLIKDCITSCVKSAGGNDSHSFCPECHFF